MKMKSMFKKIKFAAFALIIFAVAASINLVFGPNTAYASTELTSDDGLWKFTDDGVIMQYLGNEAVITLPDQLTANGVSYHISKLHWGAIGWNKTTTEINIGPNIVDIEPGSFKQLESLKRINVSPENEKYCDINGILYNKEKTFLIRYPQKNDTGVLELPDTFTYCYLNAIENAEKVKALKIPASYTGEWKNDKDLLKPESFPNLMAIRVSPENPYFTSHEGVLYSRDMTTLYWYPPKNIHSSFTIPDSVKKIEMNAFLNAERLRNLDLTSNIENISYNFEGCNLTSINNITTREEYINWDPSVKSVFQKYLHYFEDQPISISLVEQEVQYAVDNYIEEGMNDYEKIYALYNYVAKKVFYTNGDTWDPQYHCLSSVFLGDETVCEGYALAMSLLLDKVGITNCCVSGSSPEFSQHAWNLVKISGVWLQIDANWDDKGDYAGQKYFLKSKSEYEKIHAPYIRNINQKFTKYSFGVDKSIYNNNLPDCNISIGDINKDGIIDGADKDLIRNEIQAYARYSYLGYYNVLADVKLDGKIDMDDYNWLCDKLVLGNKDILIGDLNQNGVYDEEDLALLEIEIGKFNTQPGYYNILADVYYDRVLDIYDYLLLWDFIYLPNNR
ncbi:MAG TPA: leucine-rich repeat protein [Acetivibrio sp.]|nr:leucine-rich repeat protein [Acetivibrio sp.]HPT91399.1 leucine-rich repeat protein [Acetivibrio sp.]